MRRLMKHLLLSLLLLTGFASTVQADMESACAESGCAVLNLTRTTVVDDVAHYAALLQVGPGEHDVIELHRVVRELFPWIPRPTADGVFAVHGDTLDFDSAWFVGPDGGSAASSIATWFAENDVDFWAITQRDRLVNLPPGSDFSFMADWGFDQQVSDIRLAMKVARIFRLGDRLHLLGWSRGGQLAYVIGGLESQLPVYKRSADSLIIFDSMMKTDDPVVEANLCALTAQLQGAHAAGVYADDLGAQVNGLGQLAAAAPGDPSPALPGFTNLQAIMFVGGATWALSPFPFTPSYHLVGADFDEFGVPQGLLFTDVDAFIATALALPPYEALLTEIDGDGVVCSDTEFDDHLADIVVPVLNVGAAGGIGYTSEYTTTLLTSSPEVESFVVQLLPSEAVLADFGHDDIVRSPLAEDLVWSPVLDWVQSH